MCHEKDEVPDVPGHPLIGVTRARACARIEAIRDNPAHPALPALRWCRDPAMTVLALDLGTTTGWALRSADGRIVSGTVSFRPSRYDGGGMRYLRFRAWLDELVEELAVSADLLRGGPTACRH